MNEPIVSLRVDKRASKFKPSIKSKGKKTDLLEKKQEKVEETLKLSEISTFDEPSILTVPSTPEKKQNQIEEPKIEIVKNVQSQDSAVEQTQTQFNHERLNESMRKLNERDQDSKSQAQESSKEGVKARKRTSRKAKFDQVQDVPEEVLSQRTMASFIHAPLKRPKTEEEVRKEKENLEKHQIGKGKAVEQATEPSTSNIGPRVKIVGNTIIMDQETMQITTDQLKPANYESMNRVLEDNILINSASFSKRSHTQRWTNEETELFYKGLQVWKTDFSMIARMFKGRSREQIKNKYKKEERSNYIKVQNALKSKERIKQSDFEELLPYVDETKEEEKKIKTEQENEKMKTEETKEEDEDEEKVETQIKTEENEENEECKVENQILTDQDEDPDKMYEIEHSEHEEVYSEQEY